MFAWPWELRERGILGINRRNAEFILPWNEREKYPLVDDKLKTKQLAGKAGISVPELYATISYVHEVETLGRVLADRESFVIKPASGSGGQGILVFSGRIKDRFRTIHGPLLTLSDLEHHTLNALNGMFSLGGQADHVIVEYRVESDPLFEQVSFKGVPDIRIILFHSIPVMAMLRLPTSLSEGKANLHQGAIGVGINMRDGVTLSAVWGDEVVTEHPDTGQSVVGIELPHWGKLLHTAIQCSDLVGLGYLGVDIVLDRTHGPMLLEMNARPGLAIQIANRTGLASRLLLAKDAKPHLATAEERVAFARQRFASSV